MTAVASYLQARSHNGQWLIRIEDIDPERDSKTSITSILQTLQDYGFVFDARPILQSRHTNLHKHLALQLLSRDQAYACHCSRKEIALHAKPGEMGLIYPGYCSDKTLGFKHGTALRVRTDNTIIHFADKNFGEQRCNLKQESGDYVIYRADNLPSYILAASVDDLFEHYTEVVRGSDLLTLTPRQIHLSLLLKNRFPEFLHVPIITHENGEKLSKQTHAPKIKKQHARKWLCHALTDLGQEPPRNLHYRPLSRIWEWAIEHWCTDNIPTLKTIPLKY